MKKLLSIILIATLTLAGCELFPTKVDPEVVKGITQLLREHGPALKKLIITWATEKRAPTAEEIESIMEIWNQDEQKLATLLAAVDRGESNTTIVAIAMDLLGLDNIGDIIGGYDPGSGYDPRLETLALQLSQHGENLRQLNDAMNALTNKVNSNEARIDAIEIYLSNDEDPEPEPKPAHNLPIVKDKQSLIDFCVALLGREAVHGTTNHTRDELWDLSIRIRDAIIENQPDDFYYSPYKGRYRPREWYNTNRPDVIFDLEANRGIDMFAAPAKRYQTVALHLRWSLQDVQDKKPTR